MEYPLAFELAFTFQIFQEAVEVKTALVFLLNQLAPHEYLLLPFVICLQLPYLIFVGMEKLHEGIRSVITGMPIGQE